jgi:tripartite-type tricarboxylate transporter receptor subunit TctC
MPYDPVADFAPVSLLVIVPNVLVVNPDFPAQNVAELIALLEEKPGEYSYASSGNGTSLHLSGELFKSMARVDMVHVPYKGAGPALVDVMGGHVPIMFDPGFPKRIGPVGPKAAETLAKPRTPSFTRRVRQDPAA